MSVTIGHAAIDEHGKSSGGAAGDQTGQEVCTRAWYVPSYGWDVLLRPKSTTVAEKSAAACEAGCANACIGYDQYQRNTLRTQAKKAGFDLAKITAKCETDCSAFLAVCAEAAGVDMDSAYTAGNAPTTSTMRARFTATGAYTALTDSKYLTGSAYLRRGDILVSEGNHTVMVLSNGDKATTSNATTTKGETCTVELNVLRKGSSGASVKALQLLLIGYGYPFNKATVSEDLNLRSGAGTGYRVLTVMPEGATVMHLAKQSNGWYHLTYTDDNGVQYTGYASGSYLTGLKQYGADASFGAITESAVRRFQTDNGIGADGAVGAKTWPKLLGV